MKNNILIALILTYSTNLFAQDQNTTKEIQITQDKKLEEYIEKNLEIKDKVAKYTYKEDSNFHGYIGFIIGKQNSKGNLTYNNDNDTISSLNSSKEVSDDFIYPMFDINYKNFYLKTDLKSEDILLGYNWDRDNTIYIGTNIIGIEQYFYEKYFYKLQISTEEMYTNPYALNTQRQTEESTNILFEVGIQELNGFIDITYSLNSIDINDHVNSDAKQSGTEHQINISTYLFDLGEESGGGVSFLLGKGDFEGKSNNYIKAGIGYMMEIKFAYINELQLETNYIKYDFDTKNSYFNKIRDEDEINMQVIYNRYNLFDNESLFTNLGVSYEKKDSNIEFFKSEEKSMFLTLGYSFK